MEEESGRDRAAMESERENTVEGRDGVKYKEANRERSEGERQAIGEGKRCKKNEERKKETKTIERYDTEEG